MKSILNKPLTLPCNVKLHPAHQQKQIELRRNTEYKRGMHQVLVFECANSANRQLIVCYDIKQTLPQFGKSMR